MVLLAPCTPTQHADARHNNHLMHAPKPVPTLLPFRSPQGTVLRRIEALVASAQRLEQQLESLSHSELLQTQQHVLELARVEELRAESDALKRQCQQAFKEVSAEIARQCPGLLSWGRTVEAWICL